LLEGRAPHLGIGAEKVIQGKRSLFALSHDTHIEQLAHETHLVNAGVKEAGRGKLS